MSEFLKWNKYQIGKTKWIDTHRGHPCRDYFINYILNNSDINKILEIGGGELIELQSIYSQRKDIELTIADISQSFLDNAKNLRIANCVNASMHELPFVDNQFDIVFMSSVIEHSPDIVKTIKEISRVSKEFHIAMFKWKMKTGGLESSYSNKNKYYTSLFNLPKIIKELEKYSKNININVMTKEGEYINFEDYKIQCIKDSDEWRNGDRLILSGEFYQTEAETPYPCGSEQRDKV